MSVKGAGVHHTTAFYYWIWLVLILSIGLSVVLGLIGHPVLATALIFSVALFKAYLVATFYMGLRWEPGYVTVVLVIGTIFMLILFAALVPDIMLFYGRP